MPTAFILGDWLIVLGVRSLGASGKGVATRGVRSASCLTLVDAHARGRKHFAQGGLTAIAGFVSHDT